MFLSSELFDKYLFTPGLGVIIDILWLYFDVGYCYDTFSSLCLGCFLLFKLTVDLKMNIKLEPAVTVKMGL